MTISKAAHKNLTIQRAAAARGGEIRGRVPHLHLNTAAADPVISFYAFGAPAPQGSKEFAGIRGGKPVLKEASDGLHPWRNSVRAVMEHVLRRRPGWNAIDEPVVVGAVFTMPHTAAAKKRGDIFHVDTPDADKLARALGDAISPVPVAPSEVKGMIGEAAKKAARAELLARRRRLSILHDDSRIGAWSHVYKVYPGMSPDALPHPGVVVEVWKVADLLPFQDAATAAQLQEVCR